MKEYFGKKIVRKFYVGSIIVFAGEMGKSGRKKR